MDELLDQAINLLEEVQLVLEKKSQALKDRIAAFLTEASAQLNEVVEQIPVTDTEEPQ